jgi:hypothetical protein
VVAEDFLQDAQVRQWLDGVEPAWTLLTFDSLRALRREPSASQTAIRIANDLSADEIAGSAVARNTLILLRQAIERGGLPLTATGNLSRAVAAEMCKLIEWPHYDQADAFRFSKVINEPDFLPLHVVRLLAQATSNCFVVFTASALKGSPFAVTKAGHGLLIVGWFPHATTSSSSAMSAQGRCCRKSRPVASSAQLSNPDGTLFESILRSQSAF